MVEWAYNHKELLWWLASFSVFIFVVTLVVVPVVVIKIPPDYFVRGRRQNKIFSAAHPVLKGGLIVIKNILGSVLVAAGAIMLLTPGQGLFTIFVGMMLMNFPGKYRLEKWLIDRRSVRRSANWLRGRAGCRPLRFKEK